MKNTRAGNALEEKRRHLETRVAAANKLLDGMRPEIKEELGQICLKLGIHDILKGKRRRLEEAKMRSLTVVEYQLLRAFYETIFAKAKDTYELRWIESLLSPQKKGR